MAATMAAIHYLALALGFAGLFIRGLALRDSLQGASLKRVFLGDNLWGVAAAIWIVTGLLRAFGGLEKGTPFYLQSHWFWLKMGLFLLLFLLEIKPMVTFIRWRIQKKTTLTADDFAVVRTLLKLNHVEAVLVVVIPFIAAAMARGVAL